MHILSTKSRIKGKNYSACNNAFGVIMFAEMQKVVTSVFSQVVLILGLWTHTACSAVLMFRLHKLPLCATVLNLRLHMCSCAQHVQPGIDSNTVNSHWPQLGLCEINGSVKIVLKR